MGRKISYVENWHLRKTSFFLIQILSLMAFATHKQYKSRNAVVAYFYGNHIFINNRGERDTLHDCKVNWIKGTFGSTIGNFDS